MTKDLESTFKIKIAQNIYYFFYFNTVLCTPFFKWINF